MDTVYNVQQLKPRGKWGVVVDKIKNAIQKAQTLRETLVQNLREAIIQGDLKPGDRVTELELASRFGISRTPIREAFRQLEGEGFLTIIPRRGALVSSFNEKDISEFYELKALLEGFAARKATPNLTDKQIDKMRQLNQQMTKAQSKKDLKNLFKAHNEFHEVFINACGNEKLTSLIHSLVTQFQRFRYLLALSGTTEGSITQHKEIIKAFNDRNAKQAEKLVMANAIYGEEKLIKEILQTKK